MANKIQIKHGSGVPGGGKLSSFELGYATQTGQLYISTTGSNILGITPSSHSHVWSEVTGGNTSIGNAGSARKKYSWGGLYSSSSTNTGVIRIYVGTVNTMFNAKISLRSYSYLADISVGGYTYTSTGNWHLPQATGRVRGGALNVRFSGSGAHRYIQIGDTDTNWSGYLHVTIDDVSTGMGDFPSPFAVSLETAYIGTTGSTQTVGGLSWSEVTDKPTTFTPSSHTHTGTTTTGSSTTHTTAYGTISLGPMNSNYNHIYSTISKPFYFNNDMYVANGQQVLHAGNWSNYAAAKSHTHSYAAASHTHTQVAGYGVSTTAASANTIPVRDANGYMYLGWINTPSGSVGNVEPYYVYCNNTTSTDNFIRKIPFTNLADRINGYGSATNSHKHTATLLRTAIQVAANSSITFTDGANHGLYIVSVRWSTDLWLPVTVPADGLKYAHPWVNDLLPFRLSKSGTTLTLKREGGTAQWYMVHGIT